MSQAPEEETGKLVKQLDSTVEDLEANSTPGTTASPVSGSRRSGPVETKELPTISLVEDDAGTLRWRIDDLIPTFALSGRRAILPNLDGEVIWQHEIQNLGSNAVIEKFQQLDRHLNANQGLREFSKDGNLTEVEEISGQGPILVLIHGTFSKSEAILNELRCHEDGAQFLSWAVNNYRQVLTFDHPTLSVSPFLNALAISRLVNKTTADLDVVCHSRGGLVTRWWLEVLDQAKRNRRRAVMVACPLKGTSLAAPGRLRKGLDHLSNTVRAVGMIASTVPIAAGVGGLMSIVGGAVGAAAHTPAIDSIFAMIPGLAAMSRTNNNSELNELYATAGNKVEYFGVKSNFQPEDVKIWQFWKLFNHPTDRFLNALADDFVFRDEGTPAKRVLNDLVVDCQAMESISPFAVTKWCDFGTSSKVHHTNYFMQVETVRFIKDVFGS